LQGFSDRSRRNAMGTRRSQSSALLRAEAKARAKAPHVVALDLAFDFPPSSPHRASQAAAGKRRACPSARMREFAPARRCREAQGTSRARRARCGVGGGVSLVTFLSL